MGSISRGLVRRFGRFFSRVGPRVSLITRGGLLGATPRGQPWTSAVTLLPGCNGLIAWRMAVLSTCRAPSLCRHVHRALLRSVLLDVTFIIAATACPKRNYVERYSRSSIGKGNICQADCPAEDLGGPCVASAPAVCRLVGPPEAAVFVVLAHLHAVRAAPACWWLLRAH